MLKLNQGRNVLYFDNIFIIKKKIVRSSCLKTSHLGLSLNARELVLLFCFVLLCLFVCVIGYFFSMNLLFSYTFLFFHFY